LALQKGYRPILAALVDAARRVYGPRLVSLAVFGSVGRGTARPDSDVDLLLVARELPRGRLARMDEFAGVEALVPSADLSPVFKTPEEAERGSPLMIEMVEDAVVLHDPTGFLAARLERLRRRLAELGARRVPYGGAWYWDLKPDFRPGEEIEL
jgi:predicted nucleotidyltransferase